MKLYILNENDGTLHEVVDELELYDVRNRFSTHDIRDAIVKTIERIVGIEYSAFVKQMQNPYDNKE